MGRTLPTATGLWHMERAAWKPFRDALDKSQRKEFDKLWRSAKAMRSEISHIMGSKPIPFQCMLMPMLFQHYRLLTQMTYASEHGLGELEGGYDSKTHELIILLAHTEV